MQAEMMLAKEKLLLQKIFSWIVRIYSPQVKEMTGLNGSLKNYRNEGSLKVSPCRISPV